MRSSLIGFAIVGATALVAACSSSIADQSAESPAPPGPALKIAPEPTLQVPESVRVEHDRIHAALIDATRAPGSVGEAARELARVLHPHFVREEEIALPPLGLLAPLAAGEFRPEMQSVLPMTDALREELPQMLREHLQIVAATGRLQQASVEAGDREGEALARELLAHAKSEEEIFYPAAILVGEMVRAAGGARSAP
jgi:iron-sulfur cluster repair protein YtfE (RIC family)